MLFSFVDAAYDRTACRRTRLLFPLIFGSARTAMRLMGAAAIIPPGGMRHYCLRYTTAPAPVRATVSVSRRFAMRGDQFDIIWRLRGALYPHNGYAGRRLASKSSQADWGARKRRATRAKLCGTPPKLELYGRGIGYVEAHLLAAAAMAHEVDRSRALCSRVDGSARMCEISPPAWRVEHAHRSLHRPRFADHAYVGCGPAQPPTRPGGTSTSTSKMATAYCRAP